MRVPSGVARDEPSNVAFRNNFGVFRGEVEEVRLVRTRIANRFSDSLRYRIIWSNVRFSRRSGEINSSNYSESKLNAAGGETDAARACRTDSGRPASSCASELAMIRT